MGGKDVGFYAAKTCDELSSHVIRSHYLSGQMWVTRRVYRR